MINKNKIYRVEITGINNLGYGTCKIDGIVTFVNSAVTGDLLDIIIIKVNKSYCIGKIDKIITPSSFRLSKEDNKCVVSHRCGGCTYQHISYEHELTLKREYVCNAFNKAGIKDIKVNDVISTGKIEKYRNKAQYPIDKDYKVGFYANKSHDIVEMENCSLQPDIFNSIIIEVKKFLVENKISIYDEEIHDGIIRHIYLRHGKSTGQVMLCIIINADDLPHKELLISTLHTLFPEITSMILNINKDKTNVINGDKNICIYGNEYIEDILCNLTFRISPLAFYQVNHDATELLYKKVKELANLGKDDSVIDFYCGIGTIGLYLADEAKEVIGIEIIPSAIEDARVNAELNNIKNVKFYCSDITQTEKLLENENFSPSVIIIDPPRKGCNHEFIEYITRLSPNKIIYISCDPDTLARDVVIFKSFGYSCDTITPIDLFSRTGHVETVVLLSRKNPQPSLPSL